VVENVQNYQKGLETVWRIVNSLKNQKEWPIIKSLKILNDRQNIAFWTNSVIHSHHEMKALNIWLVFIRLKALKK